MSFELPPLPYSLDALEPHISRRTLEFHYGKHHEDYVSKANKLVEGTPLAEMELVEVIKRTAGDSAQRKIFNNAAQVWNHTFFWHCMKPAGGGEPTGAFADKIHQDFGSLDAFKQAFSQAAIDEFGSGWAWLVVDQGRLRVMSTTDAHNPMVEGKICLLTCDVWEHAYYLDYQNRRADFVQAFLDHLVNWDHAAAQFSGT